NLDWLATSLNLSPEMVRERAQRQAAQLEGTPLPPSHLRNAAKAAPEVDSKASELDRERLHSVLTGTPVDEQSLDQLAMVTDSFMRQSWNVNPHSLLPAVTGHFSGFGNILLGVPPALAARAYSMAGEVAFLAGYLLRKSGLTTDANFYWQASERMAQSAGDTNLQSIIFTIQGWQAHDEGQLEKAKMVLDRAQLVLGVNPNPMTAALAYSSHSYTLAAVGQEHSAAKDIQTAERYLNRVSGNDAWLYTMESIHDEVDIVRGWYLFRLQQYEDSAQNFEQILARIDSTWKAQQANILAHLGAVHAQQGDIDRATYTFSKGLRIAREAAAPLYAQRIARMRKQWLGNNDSPAVRRLDEEFTTKLVPEWSQRKR
ncbi:MAG: hypothetical protein ACREN8_00735, partial [Candidatus Dormibacteraceae bacterium]